MVLPGNDQYSQSTNGGVFPYLSELTKQRKWWFSFAMFDYQVSTSAWSTMFAEHIGKHMTCSVKLEAGTLSS